MRDSHGVSAVFASKFLLRPVGFSTSQQRAKMSPTPFPSMRRGPWRMFPLLLSTTTTMNTMSLEEKKKETCPMSHCQQGQRDSPRRVQRRNGHESHIGTRMTSSFNLVSVFRADFICQSLLSWCATPFLTCHYYCFIISWYLYSIIL